MKKIIYNSAKGICKVNIQQKKRNTLNNIVFLFVLLFSNEICESD